MISKIIFSLALLLLGGSLLNAYWNQYDDLSYLINNDKTIASLRSKLSDYLTKKEDLPVEIAIDKRLLKIDYTLDPEMMEFAQQLLKRYRSDYSTITVIDNNNGNILAAVGYERSSDKLVKYLPFSSTHPAASLFKIVTSAELLQKDEITKDSTFKYKGRGTTLYKYQLKKVDNNRWVRKQSLAKAFAYSNNVIFGKAAMTSLSGDEIYEMATKFGFNRELMKEVDLGISQFKPPKDEYHLAELASGFNQDTLISPVHAAVFPLVVANNGTLKFPKLISQVVDVETGESIKWENYENKLVLGNEVAQELQNMMEMTVKLGTASRTFRNIGREIRSSLDIGGKTGSITGGAPFGKRDWFVAYARPKNEKYGKGISISVMNINLKKWYVKSTYIAKRIIQFYFENYLENGKAKFVAQSKKSKQDV